MTEEENVIRTIPEGIHLIGTHGEEPPNGTPVGCVMDLVAWAAGEAWSDAPKCASQVIRGYAIVLNDQVLPNDQRDRLVPFIPRIIGTAGNRDADLRRAFIAADGAVRVFLPLALDATGKPELATLATNLRALAEITDKESAKSAARSAESAAWSAESAAESAESAARSAWSAKSAAKSAWSVYDAALDLLDRLIDVRPYGPAVTQAAA